MLWMLILVQPRVYFDLKQDADVVTLVHPVLKLCNHVSHQHLQPEHCPFQHNVIAEHTWHDISIPMLICTLGLHHINHLIQANACRLYCITVPCT